MENDRITLPLVSVIIPVYNSEKYIADTIRSVLAQTYTNIEIVVVDDLSTDKTSEIINELRLDHPIVFIENTKNVGASASRNIGYGASKGRFIKFLDGDDLINPEAIAAQIKLAIENPDSIVSGQWGRFYNDDIYSFSLSVEDCWQTLKPADWICSSWKNARSMTNPGIFLIPKDLIEKAGLWDENLSLIDDLEYFTRTILNANRVVFCKGSTLYYRSGVANSLSGGKGDKAYQSAYLAIEKATKMLLSKRSDTVARLACANTWQTFVYDAYPAHPDQLNKARAHLSTLPSPSIKPAGGGLAGMLGLVIGWRAVKKLQLLQKKIMKRHFNRA